MKGHNTFTMAVIKELYQLFLQKDNADYNEQKFIRRKIRKKGFYISDFAKDTKQENFSRCKLKVFYKGETDDHRFFSDSFADKIFPHCRLLCCQQN